ncbi:MAG: hypothetical protein RJB13_366 [Pseudomonadota bacterium]
MNDTESKKSLSASGTPAELSRQLGVDAHEILAAISAASLTPRISPEGDAVYDVEPVIAAVVEHKRIFSAAQDPHIKNMIRDCVLSSAESIRHFIKEENKTAYQIKQMTESRFIEVLSQVGVSLGRLEAFMAQASRVMHQMDARLTSFERAQKSDRETSNTFSEKLTAQTQPELDHVAPTGSVGTLPTEEKLKLTVTTQSVPVEELSNIQHWQIFENYLSQMLNTSGSMAESARRKWFDDVRALISMGSLEVRVEGDTLIARISPALMNHFETVVSKLPKESEVLPYFEEYYDWVKAHLDAGYPALLLYLIILCNRGGQMSWFGFLSTFVNEG